MWGAKTFKYSWFQKVLQLHPVARGKTAIFGF